MPSRLFLEASTLVSPLSLCLTDEILGSFTGVYILHTLMFATERDVLKFSGSGKDDCHKLVRENSNASNKQCESAN